jgi:hypothetical protein
MIYKLNYTDKETAIKDFLKKGVYIEVENIDKEIVLSYGKGIQAIVEIGKIVLENGTYDAEFNEITAPVYADGYAYDIMSDIEYKFDNEIFPTTPMHNFAGCEPIKEIEFNNIIDEPTTI